MAEQRGDTATSAAPEPITDGRLAGAYRWRLRVVATEQINPSVRRVTFTSPQLELLAPQPGQDLMFAMPREGGTINRRYSIRSFDAAEARVDVDAVLHGDGPGARWFAAATEGDEIEAVGPRGGVVPVAGVDRHLFVGDAAGAPALLSMLESLPAGEGHAVLAIDTDDDRQPTTAEPHVTWLVAPSADAVIDELRRHLVPGTHVYLAGERRDVARQRQALQRLGVADEATSPKNYWSRGTANAAHGEPMRDGQDRA